MYKILPFYFFFIAINSFAQTRLLVVDEYNNAVQLQKVKFQGKGHLTNATGFIAVDSTTTVLNSNDTIKSNETYPSPKITFTSISDKNLVREIIRNGKNQTLKSLAPFEYDAYNKFIIHSSEIKRGENIINKLLNKIKLEMKSGQANRHVVLSESISKRKYLDDLHESETVLWSKISGVEKPLFLSMNSQLQTIDILGKHIDILGASYVNPFHKQGFPGYHFYSNDSVVVDGETLIKVNFSNKKYTRFEALTGHAWVNKTTKAIHAIHCHPTYGRKAKLTFSIEFGRQGFIYTPKSITTTVILDNVSPENIQIKAIQTTELSNFKPEPTLRKEQFSDLAITYRKQMLDTVIRPFPLNELEKNTYEYFNQGKNLELNRSLKWGEQLFFGEFHTKHVNVILPSLIGYNEHEKLRTGLGLSTNDNLSERIKLSSFFAYGWGDKAWKGGLKADIKLIPDDKLNFIAYTKNDLIASGEPFEDLVKPYHNTAFLRRFQQNIFDQQIGSGISLSSKPMKYLSTKVNFNAYRNISRYAYDFLESDGQKVREVNLNIRYAYGERFFRFYDDRISLKTKYPIVWLHLEKSIGDSDISFVRTQLRARYTYKFIMNGTSKIEFLAGKYWGQLPYFKLFNGLGSARMKSLVKGAFETMEYNEFVSDQFLILFYSHDFGYFNFTQHKTFRPHIELAFNFGIGSLKSPNAHREISTKSFNKGYGEIGLSVNDLLLLYPFGVKLGLGVSLYHRMLNYRYPTFKENSILKLTTSVVF